MKSIKAGERFLADGMSTQQEVLEFGADDRSVQTISKCIFWGARSYDEIFVCCDAQIFVHHQAAVFAESHREPFQGAGSRATLDAALVIKGAAMAGTVIACFGAVEGAAQVSSHGR